MKKSFATFCLIASTFALSACSTSGQTTSNDTAAPYSLERTATHGGEGSSAAQGTSGVAPAERVFQRAQHK